METSRSDAWNKKESINCWLDGYYTICRFIYVLWNFRSPFFLHIFVMASYRLWITQVKNPGCLSLVIQGRVWIWSTANLYQSWIDILLSSVSHKWEVHCDCSTATLPSRRWMFCTWCVVEWVFLTVSSWRVWFCQPCTPLWGAWGATRAVFLQYSVTSGRLDVSRECMGPFPRLRLALYVYRHMELATITV